MEMKQWKQLRLLKHFLIWTPLILCWMKKEWVRFFNEIQSVFARFICGGRRYSLQCVCMELVRFFYNFQIDFMYIVGISEIQYCMQWKISLPCQSWTGKERVKNYRGKVWMKLDGLDCSVLFGCCFCCQDKRIYSYIYRLPQIWMCDQQIIVLFVGCVLSLNCSILVVLV